MAGIPSKCPKCGRTKAWQEEINAFTSGIPVGGGIRINFGMRGLLAGPIKKKLGLNTVKYRCKNCKFEAAYELPR